MGWILGIMIGIPAEVVLSSWQWNDDKRLCLSKREDWISIVGLSICGLVCLTTYVVLLLWAYGEEVPRGIQRSYCCRASFYPLIFFITYAPTFLCYLCQHFGRSPGVLGPSQPLLNLSTDC